MTGSPGAFLLLGRFGVVGRSPRYLEDLHRRGLKILLITAAVHPDEVAACRADPSHPAALLADAVVLEGSTAAEGGVTAAVMAAAFAWRGEYELVGVQAIGEMLVEPAGLIADAVGLRSPGLRASRVCRSKYLQRWYLSDWSPPTRLLPPAERRLEPALGLRFPVVIKPSGRSASSGVRAAADAAALASEIEGYGDDEALLVEERVEGPEYSVESLVQAGEVIFASVTSKETNADTSDRFVEMSHTVGDASDPTHRDLLAANAAILRRLAFADGPAHAELRRTADGAIYLMEVAARDAGGGLLYLYEFATGQPMEPAIIALAMGESAEYPPPRRLARQVYLKHDEGYLDEVTVARLGVEPAWVGENGRWPDPVPGPADGPPALRAVLVLRDRGDYLGALEEAGDRAVTFFIDAATVAELDDLEQRVRDAITVEVTSPDPALSRQA